MSWRNWGRNLFADPLLTVHPRSTLDVADTVNAHPQLKVIGSGHSFSPIAVPETVQVDLSELNKVLGHDPITQVVHVQAGITIRELNQELHRRGLALPNLGDIDAQTIAGAIATGTHGTGATLPSLSANVVAARIVTGTGEVVEITENSPHIHAIRTNLGALGIVTEFWLRCVPSFTLVADEQPMEFSDVLANWDDLIDGNDHFEFYWFPNTTKALTKRNNRVRSTDLSPVPTWRRLLDDELVSNQLFGQFQQLTQWRPGWTTAINQLSSVALSERHYADQSFRVFVSPRRVRFIEAEFALPREAGQRALAELQRWFAVTPERISFPIEVRFSAADSTWLSTGYQRDSVHIAVHQYYRKDYRRYFGAVQAIMASHEARPHWGKLHHLDASYLAEQYPRFADFWQTKREFDPHDKFTNAYLRRVLGSDPP